MNDPKLKSKPEMSQPEVETPMEAELRELLEDEEEYLWG